MEPCQLNGTSRDVEQAEEIRARRIVEFDEILAPGLIGNNPLTTVAVAEAIDALLQFNSCSLWIDTQDETAAQIIADFMAAHKETGYPA